MFEKSLYDLIRGLRNHKGKEREYIQESLRECKKEIKGQDMDLKATALLKLTYLEMFGHDMSWASFHVLEVMASQKYVQKKVGYLAAVQSFRPDTEVLMLAENQLKKDLTSPTPVTISLPLMAIPHLINPSMANSLLSDLLPRLTHSQPAIRKKTIVTLYRLALVYPETLRPAWPKIKERLQDDNEDPSVTAAIVNVICELGWRRPQDFLPLAPRLFSLLVQGGNNWMAIKIIKLFATLTPLEPRLIKKLLPALTSIIKTTPAMSLLYECINGIIQGGILEAVDGTSEGEDLVRLCVGKLRGMLSLEDDPNLKYVALLAFEKIVSSHAHLVSLHQDVILECIDDADISIRMRALDLVVGMVTSDNLIPIVGRLMRQLKNAPLASPIENPSNDRGVHSEVVPTADSDSDEAEESLRANEKGVNQPPPLPEDYRINVIQRILEMCSRETYTNIVDFDWYIDVLAQLVRVCPAARVHSDVAFASPWKIDAADIRDISYNIGTELQNVAVRVRSVRPEATVAAESLVLLDKKDQVFPISGNGGQGVLESAIWIVGEYTPLLNDSYGTLTSLLHHSTLQLPSPVLAIAIQSIIKIFSFLVGDDQISWTAERKSTINLLMARVINFLESLSSHPNLEVQERSVEFLELLRLAAEATSEHVVAYKDDDFAEPPLLLTQAIPALFTGLELNPVASGAQRKVPLPDDLNLDMPLNENLLNLLQGASYERYFNPEEDEITVFYNERTVSKRDVIPAAERLELEDPDVPSYQQSNDDDYVDTDILARRRAERRERYKDDPFYIANEADSGVSTPLHNILRASNGEEVDLDSIPVMDLQLDNRHAGADDKVKRGALPTEAKRKPKKHIEIMQDENLGLNEPGTVDLSRHDVKKTLQSRAKRSLLEVNSSGLASLSLEESDNSHIRQLDIERRAAEEAEMSKALKEVEKLRLEMQRATERIQARDAPPEGTLVKRKKKKKAKVVESNDTLENDAQTVTKKKKKAKQPQTTQEQPDTGDNASAVKPKKKKKRAVILDEPTAREDS